MGRSSKIVFRPLGVIGIISPWNFPLATPADEVVMALMAGNAVVLKPSELTPLIALKIGDIFTSRWSACRVVGNSDRRWLDRRGAR